MTRQHEHIRVHQFVGNRIEGTQMAPEINVSGARSQHPE